MDAVCQGFSVQEINEDEFAALDAIRILNDDDLVPDQPVDLLVRCCALLIALSLGSC